jgi:CheY-like chemotaxis protein
MTMPTILAIEDDAMGRVALLSTAEHVGIDITVAHSLGSAAAVLAAQSFDLIFVEWHMLIGDVQTSLLHLTKLSERFSGRRVPVLVVSAFPLSPEQCSELGIDDCLIKPYRLEDFIHKLELLLGQDLFIRSHIKAS